MTRSVQQIVNDYLDGCIGEAVAPLCKWAIADMIALANLLDAEILKRDCERARPGGPYDDHC
jgi:hypothetical protein